MHPEGLATEDTEPTEQSRGGLEDLIPGRAIRLLFPESNLPSRPLRGLDGPGPSTRGEFEIVFSVGSVHSVANPVGVLG